MKKLIQTKLHNPPESRGNCFPTVIACFLDLESPDEVLQIQDLYDKKDIIWHCELDLWFQERGWEWGSLKGHLDTDEYYLVTGPTQRSSTTKHVCIYHKGELWHDPHPDGTGLTKEEYFEYLIKT